MDVLDNKTVESIGVNKGCGFIGTSDGCNYCWGITDSFY